MVSVNNKNRSGENILGNKVGSNILELESLKYRITAKLAQTWREQEEAAIHLPPTQLLKVSFRAVTLIPRSAAALGA